MKAELRESVLRSAAAQPSAPREMRRRRDAMVLLAGVLATLASFVLVWGGVVVGARSPANLLVPAGGWALLALVATLNALARGPSMLGRPTQTLVTIALLIAPVMYAWATGCTAAMSSFGEAVPWRANLGCFIATLSLAALPFATFGVLRRGSDPVHPRALGAALGASAGAWGSVLIDLHCVVTHWAHVAVAHVVPVVLFAALGALLGKRVLGLR